MPVIDVPRGERARRTRWLAAATRVLCLIRSMYATLVNVHELLFKCDRSSEASFPVGHGFELSGLRTGQ